MMKSMYRTAGDPKLWHEKFLRDKRMEGGDHTSHELRTLCDSLLAAILGALASVKIQCRRIAVIIESYNDLQHPSWTTARFYGEGTQADAAIAPALRSYVTSKG